MLFRSLSIAASIDLPFCPRELAAFADGSRLVVADAFGGRIAVVDLRRRAIESVRSLPAHNIRGLAPSPDGQTLVVAQQVLRRLARTTFEDVHWGSLVSNHLRILRLDAVLAPGSDSELLRGSRLLDLRLRPDPAPTVQLERPSASRDVLSLVPEAELALHVIAEDPY